MLQSCSPRTELDVGRSEDRQHEPSAGVTSPPLPVGHMHFGGWVLPDSANEFPASHNFHPKQSNSSWDLPKGEGLQQGVEALPEQSKMPSACEEMAATGKKS